MTRRIDDANANAETFWPGYVDAVTNLVLNLLFVVVIMTVAVFMFAMELGRMQPIPKSEAPEVSADVRMPSPSAESAATEQVLRSQNTALRAQIEGLKAKEGQVKTLQERIRTLEIDARRRPSLPTADPSARVPADVAGASHSVEPAQVITATESISIPERSLEKTVPSGRAGGIVVKFADDAIALTRVEAEELRKALAPFLGGGAKIEVVVPAGFSEAKRLGFYRAMAVRNQLIELKVSANRIEISVREGSAGSDSSRVMVSPR